MTYDQMINYTGFNQVIKNDLYLRFLWTVSIELAQLHFTNQDSQLFQLTCLYFMEYLVNRVPSFTFDETISFIKRSAA